MLSDPSHWLTQHVESTSGLLKEMLTRKDNADGQGKHQTSDIPNDLLSAGCLSALTFLNLAA